MPKHELATTWHSTFNGKPDADFRLDRMSDDGTDFRLCDHNGKGISGLVTKFSVNNSPDVHCYLVEINQVSDDVRTILQYRGVAVYNPAATPPAFTTIVGVRRAVPIGFGGAPFDAFTAGQEEGTWTGTQP